MAISSVFDNIATTTRASKAWDDGAWDFVSGSAIGALVEYAANAPRITSSGLLVEEGTTNELRNPRAEGGTAGTLSGAGALPTYWGDGSSNMSGAGMDLAYGTENGREYTDLIFSADTPSGHCELRWEGGTTITTPASTATPWAVSCGLKLVSGSMTNVDTVDFTLVERTSGGSYVSQAYSSDIKASIDSSTRRFFHAFTSTGGATVERVVPALRLAWTSGAWTFTLRVYHPQCEQAVTASSIVLPAAASPNTSTRSDDAISAPNGPWHNDGVGTIFAQIKPNAAVASTFLSLGPDNNDRISIVNSGSGADINMAASAGGSSVMSNNVTTYTVGTAFKAAISWNTDDYHWSVKGVTGDDTSGAMPSGAAKLTLGNAPTAGATVASFYLQDFRYFPRQLSDAEVNALGSA